MRKIHGTIWLFASLAALTACGTVKAIGYGPGVTPAQRDEIHRTAVRPAIEPSGDFVSSVVECDLPMSPEEYVRASSTFRLEDVLFGSKHIPRVVRTEPLTGVWGAPGSRRRVVLEDGNTALEELIEDRRPALYLYEVWNFTSADGKYVRYAVGKFEVTGDAKNAHVRWTYSFRPSGWPASWFAGRFVHGEYHEFMQNGLNAIRKKTIEAQKQSAGTVAN